MKRFLVIKPSSLGDVLHAFPAVSALADSCKEECKVDWLIHPAFAQLLDFLPFVEKKILFERKKLGSFLTFFPAFFRLLHALREVKYDAVYDLQGLFRSGLFSFFTKSPLRFGSSAPREKAAGFFYNRKMTYPENTLHAVDKLCHMVVSSGAISSLPERYFTLPVSGKYREEALRKTVQAGFDPVVWKEKGGKIIAVAPGARWKSKTWEKEFFASLVNALHKEFPQTHFLFSGSKGEKETISAITEMLDKEVSFTDMGGKTDMGELVELIRLADILLCNDSGPMHIAAFTDTLPVAFFGPTDPDLTGPCCKKALVFQKKDLPCIKCFKRECKEVICHKMISVQDVIDSLRNNGKEEERK